MPSIWWCKLYYFSDEVCFYYHEDDNLWYLKQDGDVIGVRKVTKELATQWWEMLCGVRDSCEEKESGTLAVGTYENGFQNVNFFYEHPELEMRRSLSVISEEACSSLLDLGYQDIDFDVDIKFFSAFEKPTRK